MTTAAIILLCSILIIAYLFDLSSRKTKIPGIILLIFAGVFLKYLAGLSSLDVPPVEKLTPLLGTVGLILIVLEGSMDLTLSRNKIELVKKTFLSGVILLVINSLIVTVMICIYYEESFMKALVNAIPLGIISSALAIPAAQNLSDEKKEFIVYESSFSDILGILFFNFFAFNEYHGLSEIWIYTGQLLTIVVISIGCSLALGYLLQHIQHHIKFIPIIATLILVYSIAKLMHMPSLVLVLVFGIFLNNLRLLNFVPIIGNKVDYDLMEKETINFKHLVGELSFAIRSYFFIVLGFATDMATIFDLTGLMQAIALASVILISRWILFKYILKVSMLPEVFFAPRGLITVLLFLSIPASYVIPQITSGLLLQLVLVTSLIMTTGLMISRKKDVPATS